MLSRVGIMVCFSLMTSQMMKVTSTNVHIVQLRENEPVGTLVADLSSYLNGALLGKSNKNFQLLSEKLSTPIPHQKGDLRWFSLNQKTGTLVQTRNINREAICGSFRSCFILVQVYAIVTSRIIELQVNITDVNDEYPTFRANYVLLNVSEKTAVGSKIDLDQYAATDKDAGINSAITYSLNPNPNFSLIQFVDDTGVARLQLEIKQKLDYETKSFFPLTLFAHDHGQPSLSSHIPFQINIIDENDNEPQFTQTEYFASLPEDAVPGRIVIQVRAEDPDSGLAGTVSYVIAGPNKVLASSFFNLNFETGEISLKKPIDREEFDEFHLFIEARDGGDPVRVGRAPLVVYIDDVNDNAPDIAITFIAQEKNDIVYVPENTSVNSNLAYVRAKDSDVTANGDVTVSMEIFSLSEIKEYSDKSNAFRLNNKNFIFVNELLDAETQTHYKIILNATDGGKAPRFTTKEIFVIILDVNDHAPQFAKDIFKLYILESLRVGKEIIQMRAVDLDQKNKFPLLLNEENKVTVSRNGNVTYSLIGGEGIFSIQPKSGIITLVGPLDREQKTKWDVVVIATDGGFKNPQKTTCRLIINVVDTNDNFPVFINPTEEGATFYGTIKRDHVITRIQAIDQDSGRNGKVEYHILSIDGLRQDKLLNSSLFIIDYVTGDLRINKSYDNLTSSLGKHSVVVQARDQGFQPMKSEKLLNLVITNGELIPIPNSSLKTAMSFTTLLLIISISVVFLLISVGIVICILRRKKRNAQKENRGSKKPSRGSVSIDATLRSNESVELKQKKLYFKTSMEKVLPMQENKQKYKKKHDLEFIHQIRPDFSIVGRTEEILSNKFSEENRERSKNYTEKLLRNQHPQCDARAQKDFYLATENTNLLDERKYVCLKDIKTQCSDECLDRGHGDACWFPRPGESKTTSATFYSNDDSYPYVSLRKSLTSKQHGEQIKTLTRRREDSRSENFYAGDIPIYHKLSKPVYDSSSVETVPSLLSQRNFLTGATRSKADFAPIGSSTDTGYMTDGEIV